MTARDAVGGVPAMAVGEALVEAEPGPPGCVLGSPAGGLDVFVGGVGLPLDGGFPCASAKRPAAIHTDSTRSATRRFQIRRVIPPPPGVEWRRAGRRSDRP